MHYSTVSAYTIINGAGLLERCCRDIEEHLSLYNTMIITAITLPDDSVEYVVSEKLIEARAMYKALSDYYVNQRNIRARLTVQFIDKLVVSDETEVIWLDRI